MVRFGLRSPALGQAGILGGVGQHFQKLADIGAAGSDAPALAAELISWLVEAGIISGAADAGCVLAGTGYPPGPRYHDAVTTAGGDRVLSLRTNGVAVVTGRTVFHGDPGADVSCPGCGTPVRFAEVIAPAIGEWHAGAGNGSRPCPQCGTRHALNEWDWQPPWAFGYLGVEFWNWPPLSRTFAQRVSSRLGHRCIVASGKL